MVSNKEILCFIFLVFISISASAQDRIINNDGSVYNCKITGSDSTMFYFETVVDGYTLKRSIAKTRVREVRFGVVNNNQTEVKEPSRLVSKKDERSNHYRKYRFYLVSGVSITSFQGNTATIAADISGPHGEYSRKPRLPLINSGIGVERPMSQSLIFQGGLEYVPKGNAYSRTGDGSNSMRLIFKTNYIEMPLSLVFSPGEMRANDKVQYYLKGGIIPGVMIISKIKSKSSASGYDSSSSDSQTFEDTSKFDLCALYALGVKTGDHFRIECRIEQGLLNIMNPNATGIVLYNRSLSFNCSYVFN
jgi:hypothetical protein